MSDFKAMQTSPETAKIQYPADYVFNPYTGQRLQNESSPNRTSVFPPINNHPQGVHNTVVSSNMPPQIYQNRSIQPLHNNISAFTVPAVQHIMNQQYPGMGNSVPIMVVNPDQPNNGGPLMCQFCSSVTGQTVRRSVGGTAMRWAILLSFCSPLVCWIPCVLDGCKDAELVCTTCNNVKTIIYPPWCCP